MLKCRRLNLDRLGLRSYVVDQVDHLTDPVGSLGQASHRGRGPARLLGGAACHGSRALRLLTDLAD
jgi:hypothetical protein